ncbi:DUF1972 domain-containing protein [Martelella mediterranea]|uniref:Glycosyl transferases group 1 n=1 Tax=Martelella mediterranea DSM 17316 TaxID=1122214 RepID=A0A1U9Z048_9HYPH|nr:DUF1972 domain-containing protein [Martelella mediterranea]AQZ51038.1 Glycosyl transferases group 1 [Martelella mediterranea DSM 17316]
MSGHRIAIIGTVGVPACYGGFETLVDNLLEYNELSSLPHTLTVYCSKLAYERRLDTYRGARLVYIPLKANGAQSIPYDVWSLLSAIRGGADTLLLLGVSGAIALPLIRFFTRTRIVTNIDGLEWRREKWGRFQRWFLKLSEALAVRHSHVVISDNGAISEYVEREYGKTPSTIAYGGDHAIRPDPIPLNEVELPLRYAFNVCRIEPENNVHMMLEAFEHRNDIPLVCVGNWDRSAYGQELKRRYADASGIRILDPVYDVGKLRTLRENASFYIHGHSAGGTNPSLIEAMQFGVPVFAFDCAFNRHSTEDKALFFKSAADLVELLEGTDAETMKQVGAEMRRISEARYTWSVVAKSYFDCLDW